MFHSKKNRKIKGIVHAIILVCATIVAVVGLSAYGDSDSSQSGSGSGDSDGSSGDGDDSEGSGDGDSDGDGDGDTDDTDTDTDTDTGDGDTDECGESDGTELSSVTISGDIPTYKNDAKGAYTIFHDDTCWDFKSSHFKVAAPELEKRGLIAAFGLVAAGCDGWDPETPGTADGKFVKADLDQWTEVNALGAAGHEMVNHSFGHNPITGGDYPYDIEVEIVQADDLLRKGSVAAIDFYIFPQDLYSGTEISKLQSLDYLGARTGKGQMNTPGSLNAFALNYDVHASPTDSNPYQKVGLNKYVDDAISSGGYAIREFHAVVDTLPTVPEKAYWMILKGEYTAHLDHVQSKVESGDLWVAGPAQVIRYLKAREVCPTPTFADGALSWDSPSDECLRHGEDLSYNIQTSEEFSLLGGSQDGRCLDVTAQDGSNFWVSANPARGDAKIWGVD